MPFSLPNANVSPEFYLRIVREIIRQNPELYNQRHYISPSYKDNTTPRCIVAWYDLLRNNTGMDEISATFLWWGYRTKPTALEAVTYISKVLGDNYPYASS